MPRTAVDLFCGSGGVTAGLKAAGWKVIAALDNDLVAASTYAANHPEVKFVLRDIESSEASTEIYAAVAKRPIDLLVICAPCQPFSSQNRKKGRDHRQSLIVKSLKFVSLLQPSLVFFENVPGLAGPSHQPVLRELRAELRRLRYLVTDPLVRDACTFGVPQRRKRCIMVAAKSAEALKAFVKTDATQPERTVSDAIGRLPLLDSAQKHSFDPLHRARNHSELALLRLARIPKDGGSRASLPEDLVLRCHRGSKAFPDVYGRMSWSKVAPTLTTGCTDVTRGRYAHPAQDRAITLREAARLQTFDDDYQFVGNASQIATQIGNAVPPAMVAHLTEAFEAALAVRRAA